MTHNFGLSTLRLVTRKSALALWQAEYVKQQLQIVHPDLAVQVIGISTKGDQNLDNALSKIGGKGLFVKELEQYLLTHEADIAVHSMKDMPADMPQGLTIGAILKRANPSDAWVSSIKNGLKGYTSIQSMPAGAVIGSSSLRRQSQLYALRPDLTVTLLRGNVDTRIQKLDNDQFDAIILACCGLERLGLAHRISEKISIDMMLPAVGQGALGIECRVDDPSIQALIAPLHHIETANCVLAERNMNAYLGGGCQFPVAGWAILEAEGSLVLKGLVATPNGKVILRAEAHGPQHAAEDVGQEVAMQLLAQGAKEIMDVCYV